MARQPDDAERRALRRCRPAGARERLRHRREDAGLAVDKRAVDIENDHFRRACAHATTFRPRSSGPSPPGAACLPGRSSEGKGVGAPAGPDERRGDWSGAGGCRGGAIAI